MREIQLSTGRTNVQEIIGILYRKEKLRSILGQRIVEVAPGGVIDVWDPLPESWSDWEKGASRYCGKRPREVGRGLWTRRPYERWPSVHDLRLELHSPCIVFGSMVPDSRDRDDVFVSATPAQIMESEAWVLAHPQRSDLEGLLLMLGQCALTEPCDRLHQCGPAVQYCVTFALSKIEGALLGEDIDTDLQELACLEGLHNGHWSALNAALCESKKQRRALVRSMRDQVRVITDHLIGDHEQECHILTALAMRPVVRERGNGR